jgi:hypothetical protein
MPCGLCLPRRHNGTTTWATKRPSAVIGRNQILFEHEGTEVAEKAIGLLPIIPLCCLLFPKIYAPCKGFYR